MSPTDMQITIVSAIKIMQNNFTVSTVIFTISTTTNNTLNPPICLKNEILLVIKRLELKNFDGSL